MFRLPEGERGKQHAQKSCRDPVRPFQKCHCAFLDRPSDLLQIQRANVRPDNLPPKNHGHNERKNAYAQKELHPICDSHKSSQLYGFEAA
jgi:hypothetical protein